MPQAEVANALLRRVHLSAALSAEPVLALLGTLPRDLRDGFLPLVPHVISTLTALVDEGKLTRNLFRECRHSFLPMGPP